MQPAFTPHLLNLCVCCICMFPDPLRLFGHPGFCLHCKSAHYIKDTKCISTQTAHLLNVPCKRHYHPGSFKSVPCERHYHPESFKSAQIYKIHMYADCTPNKRPLQKTWQYHISCTPISTAAQCPGRNLILEPLGGRPIH